MNEIRKSVSDNLKLFRKKNKLTQEDFADKYNVSEKTIAKWEQGGAEVPLDIILMLRENLNKSLDQIYGLEKSIDQISEEEIMEYIIREFIKDPVARVDYFDDGFCNEENMRLEIEGLFNYQFKSEGITEYKYNNICDKVEFYCHDERVLNFLLEKKLVQYGEIPIAIEEGKISDCKIGYTINKRLAKSIIQSDYDMFQFIYGRDFLSCPGQIQERRDQFIKKDKEYKDLLKCFK